MIVKQKKLLNNKGFSFIEILTYIFITTTLLVVIGSLVFNNFNAQKQLKSSNIIQHNMRFITHFISNRIHNVESIEDVNPAPEQILFYTSSTTRFSLGVESDNLTYRETEDLGGGFPEQSTANPIILNSNDTRVSNLVLTPMSDNYGKINQGVNINFDLTIGDITDTYGYVEQNLNTFISIR